ncbi:kelch repeat-containing protein [Hyalangium gracile]|uniref:kelch repeat-containing protein n=1 Tax=Hyalangium gracile TaxID=394092 RepID=UPI001CC8FC44|nr:kelch repeat-containing protein [Hyalangium gracile]
MRKALAPLMLALTLALQAGCSPSSSSSGTGSARFAVSELKSLSSEISRVSVTSSAVDIPSVSIDLAPTQGIWGGIIGNLPAGADRSFLAQAFDDSGTLLFEGSASGVTISANQTTLVAITLQQVNPPPPFENEAPLIDSLVASSTTIPTAGSITLVASAHDPNPGDTLSYAWSATAGTFSSPSEAATSWTAPVSTGIQTLTLTVTDSRGLASSIVLAVNVTLSGGEGDAQLSISFNRSPLVAALSASPTHLVVGQTTSVSVAASDPDGDSLSYSWSASCAGTWTHASASSARFTPSLVPAGSCNNCRLSVSVSDGRGGQSTGTVALCVRSTPPVNHLNPVIIRSYRSSDTASPGQELTFEVVASDPEGSALTFSWAAATGSLGTPSSDASRSRITWTAPACVSTSAPPTVTATVTNAFSLATSRSFTVTGLPTCSSGRWDPTGPMLGGPRWGHVSVLLPDGKALVAAGSAQKRSFFLDTAELYDPSSNTWSETGRLVEARFSPTATVLPDGKVLVTGGESRALITQTAELYDPATGTWSYTGSMLERRENHTAALLPNGRVLVAGGNYLFGSVLTAELYDPATGTWSYTGSLLEPIGGPATLLPNGKVLVLSEGGTAAQLYDPATGTWSHTGSPLEPIGGPATVLLNGQVLVARGMTAQLYDPASGTWSHTGSPLQPVGDSATLLLDGRVLALGQSTAQLYEPATGTWSTAPPTAIHRGYFTATRLLDGRVLVAGTPPNTEEDFESAEVYTP